MESRNIVNNPLNTTIYHKSAMFLPYFKNTINSFRLMFFQLQYYSFHCCIMLRKRTMVIKQETFNTIVRLIVRSCHIGPQLMKWFSLSQHREEEEDRLQHRLPLSFTAIKPLAPAPPFTARRLISCSQRVTCCTLQQHAPLWTRHNSSTRYRPPPQFAPLPKEF